MRYLRIGRRMVGGGKPCYIIAEAGSNHDGNLRKAKELIRVSKEAGADAVKFQSFRAERLVQRSHPAFAELKRLEVPTEWHRELKQYADRTGITFFSTPFDEGRATLLDETGVGLFKIASGDITHIPLIAHIARFRKPVILSTGMSTMNEIKRAMAAIASTGNKKVALLHCVSRYPAQPSDFNLLALDTLRAKFRLPVGLSDHSLGIYVTAAAVALGASLIERHITLDKKLRGPDHSFSLEPDEFEMMVKSIRAIEAALGNGLKAPKGSELAERTWARRGVYAKGSICKGEVIDAQKLKCVRPYLYCAPYELNGIIGRRARVRVDDDEPIRQSYLTRS